MRALAATGVCAVDDAVRAGAGVTTRSLQHSMRRSHPRRSPCNAYLFTAWTLALFDARDTLDHHLDDALKAFPEDPDFLIARGSMR